jgi:hypothetical protein
MRLDGKRTSLTHWRFLVDIWRRGRRGIRPSCCGSTPWKGRTSATALIRQAQDLDLLPGRPTPGFRFYFTAWPAVDFSTRPTHKIRFWVDYLASPAVLIKVSNKFTRWLHYLASSQFQVLDSLPGQPTSSGPWFTTWPAHSFRSLINYLASPQV